MSMMQMLMMGGASAPTGLLYTFEMWGPGGGGGGGHTGSVSGTEDGGPGGAGAFLSGSFTGLTSGTVLEVYNGAKGNAGGDGSTSSSARGGSGGGASAIRISGGAVIAVAGGGGGGGGGGATALADGTGGRGGNSVGGTGVYATDVGDVNGGIGGQSGTSTTAGVLTGETGATPAAKTEDLQDGGFGQNGALTTFGSGQTTASPEAGWGGRGGTSGRMSSSLGPGGGGGAGYFGGSGGGSATSGAESGGGGGGGGSYVNSSYVYSYTSEEGTFESRTAHGGIGIDQLAGSTAVAYTTDLGRGGQGMRSATNAADDGNDGGVFIYNESGTLVYSLTSNNAEGSYTLP